jgi:chromosome segregation ATPase
MRMKIGIIVLAILAGGLLIALLAVKRAGDDQRKEDLYTVLDFSNQLTTANASLDDLRQVNLILTNDVSASREALETASNNLAAATAALADTRAALENSQSEVTNLNARINDLSAENKVLDDRATTLSNTIVALNIQIADTRRKLASSESNNALLAIELQKQMAQKMELQRQYNDLDAVRVQVRKLRDEEFSARRLQWIQNGTAPENQPKGAQLLMLHPASASKYTKPASTNHVPQFDLNVEVGSDGSVHVLPPATNSTAH